MRLGKIKSLLCFGLFFWFGLFFNNYAMAGCFMAVEEDHVIKKQGDCETRYPPFSTFKIAISLMGYDSEILIDETHPRWDYKKEYVDWLDRWKQPHDPRLWIANSCVWYSRLITKKLGVALFDLYTKKLEYGNQDASGDKGTKNGLTNAWLSSSLAISPVEQIRFLQKLINNSLAVSVKAHEMTKKILFVEDLKNGWKLYGKTGNGSQLNADKTKKLAKQAGWFVGWIEKNARAIVFTSLIVDSKKQDSYASVRAKASAKDELNQVITSIEQAKTKGNKTTR